MLSLIVSARSIGEESYSAGTRPPLTNAPTFCVDPIGTQSLYARLDRTYQPPRRRRDD